MNLLTRYGLIGSLRIIISSLYTKLFFSNARLIRVPFDIRNKKYIQIGAGLTTGFNCRIEAFPSDPNVNKVLIIGMNVEMNDYVHIAAAQKVVIGNNVLVASKVFISDINHGRYDSKEADSPITSPNDRRLFTKAVTIDDNVWLGESVCVMPGVKIGRGSIIGALSVVTKDIPPNSIAVGSPAKVIKTYDFTLKEWVRVS